MRVGSTSHIPQRLIVGDASPFLSRAFLRKARLSMRLYPSPISSVASSSTLFLWCSVHSILMASTSNPTTRPKLQNFALSTSTYTESTMSSVQSSFMASTSNTSTLLQLEDFPPSTSTSSGSSVPPFVQYKPPTTRLPFHSSKRYHVFLSFRGPDVRKSLVDHLFQALSAAGLNVFLDSDKLEKGEIIELSLERAIESSAIRIPIFSKGYGDSAWCLKEATAMLNSPGLIIPLFYHVEPTHVRYPENGSSPYNRSFLKYYGHSDRYRGEEIDGWKRALRDICKRSGWSMDITGG
ncbi:hypothetical protein SUGI_0727340 [Cryptomeria japonica]|nr:hypothetical protein SUGI_0727340 [Cryptomeria japonica]